jgi:hypothetical protein
VKAAATKEQEIHRLGALARPLPPQLQSLVSHWLRKCGGRQMPAQGEMPVAELRPWLADLALIDVADGGRVRLCGVNLIRRLGREATDTPIDELAADIAGQLRAVLKAAGKAMAPVIAVSYVRLGRVSDVYCEAALPLSGRDGGIAIVMLGSLVIRES